MKKTVLCLTLFIALFALIFSGCKKDQTTPDTTSTTTPASTGGFTYTPAGGTATKADSAHYYSSFTTIFAFKNGSANSFEINLSSLAVGAYTLSSATGNALTYVASAITYTAHSGSVLITTNNGSKLSGTFNATLNGGSVGSVSGQFTDLPQRN